MPLELHGAPTCGVLTRKQTPCHARAMANGRCRWHGGADLVAPKGSGENSVAAITAQAGEHKADEHKADEHSGQAITKERERWARLLDNSSHYRRHFSR